MQKANFKTTHFKKQPAMKKPIDIGILAIEAYFPKTFVAQKDLEKAYNISPGKYTIGLGQEKMAFSTDHEDVCSISLTVFSKLVESYGINISEIGRLEVATETAQDHSKSVKTFLMDLFVKSGNFNVEGIDSMNACYAATNALFNSVAWIESSDWDGRLAVVVAADIAEYAAGPARPTGGCGAIAFVIGPNAPIIFETRCRFSHMENAFDFYKPHLDSPFPVVDGQFSNECYLKALDNCYNGYVNRVAENYNKKLSVVCGDIDFVVFHAPYNKLVQKSFARLIYNDFKKYPENKIFDNCREIIKSTSFSDSYSSRPLMTNLLSSSKKLYEKKTKPSEFFPKQIGNTYTASAYFGLFSLLSEKGTFELNEKRVLIFSYGSGFASSMFSFKIRNCEKLEQISSICAKNKILLEKRSKTSVEIFENKMTKKEKLYLCKNFTPTDDLNLVWNDCFKLKEKDEKGRKRYYQ